MNTRQYKSRMFDPLSWIAAVVFGVSYVLTPVMLHTQTMDPPARYMIALVPLSSFILFLIRFNRLVSSLDELGKRIHLESIAYTFALMVVLSIMKYTVMLAFPGSEVAGLIPDGLLSFPFLLLIGGFIVRKRYA